ncbi:hypothetical protein SSTU70S_04760 [Stutzerimonas stutzeri]
MAIPRTRLEKANDHKRQQRFRDDGYRAAFSCKPAHGPGRAMPVLQQEYEDGYAEGAADRSLLTSLKSAVLEALDGDSIKAFGSFEVFKESLDVSNHYQYEDAADDQPSDRTAEFLPLAYEELCASHNPEPAATGRANPAE